MSEFFEPELPEDDVVREKPKVFTEAFFNSVIKKTIASGDIPPDHNLYILLATDEQGIQAVIGIKRNPFNGNLSINFIGEHEWDGDNRVGAKVIFSHK
jgi:hypothetical protein